MKLRDEVLEAASYRQNTEDTKIMIAILEFSIEAATEVNLTLPYEAYLCMVARVSASISVRLQVNFRFNDCQVQVERQDVNGITMQL